MTFKVNPLTRDLVALKNETAIARSIRNLIMTKKGERFFDFNLGCSVSELLFEVMDEITASRIRSEIEEVIQLYEPRVELIEVNTSPNFDSYQYDILIRYNIIGIEASPQELSFILQSTR
jgi:phage baseplate assembly protein W